MIWVDVNYPSSIFVEHGEEIMQIREVEKKLSGDGVNGEDQTQDTSSLRKECKPLSRHAVQFWLFTAKYG